MHLSTSDDCQQLLPVLCTTEEKERMLWEAWKLVLSDTGVPTQNPAGMDAKCASKSTARLYWLVSELQHADSLT